MASRRPLLTASALTLAVVAIVLITGARLGAFGMGRSSDPTAPVVAGVEVTTPAVEGQPTTEPLRYVEHEDDEDDDHEGSERLWRRLSPREDGAGAAGHREHERPRGERDGGRRSR